ncbi:MAG: undecaprenyldiphospho-muramoylpentapeptide beta-N-acetylglucosaminyltransferase [bacterium]
MKLAIVSGGTGGHIYPGIALAEELLSRGGHTEVLFIGSLEGLEKKIVKAYGFKIKLIRARALLRKVSYKALSAPFVSLIGFFQSIFILLKFSPKVLVATGGYVSLPVTAAAKILRVPIVLLEQNVLPGFVNRLCSRLADKVFLSFVESKKYLSGEVVGNPVRRSVLNMQRSIAREDLKISAELRVVLVMGGSQGSKKINELVLSSLERIPDNVFVLHIVGGRDYGWVKNYLEGKAIKNYQALPYLENIATALAVADLVVSRAGATAIAEFLARGLPMILIPFPYAADNHQLLNAQVLVKEGCAKLVEEKDFSSDKFIQLIGAEGQGYDKMKQACHRLAKPDAAERIVDYLNERV